MQFPRHCVAPRFHIVGIATFVDAVESSFNRIACETAASARAACVPRLARGSDGMRLGPTLRAWVRWYARGSDTSRVGPMVCAWAAPPRRISRGWRACYGLTRMFSGSRASGTPGQASLGPSRRAPCPRHPVVGVCYRGGLRRGRRRPEARPHRQQTGGLALHEDPCVTCSPMTSPPNGGELHH